MTNQKLSTLRKVIRESLKVRISRGSGTLDEMAGRGPGFGDVMLAYLQKNGETSTHDLAKAANVTLLQAYNRLMFLSYKDRVRSTGKGNNRSWALPGESPMNVPTAAAKRGRPAGPGAKVRSPEDIAAGVYDQSTNVGEKLKKTWKPDIKHFKAYLPAEPLKLGDKLLVDFPEEWRNSMVISITRLPETDVAPDWKGVAVGWDMRDNHYAHVDTITFHERGWKIARLNGAKDLAKLGMVPSNDES